MIQKVLAYVIRHSEAGHEVLVFHHRDHPDAGLQVPGGTVEPGEALNEAVLREVAEESGLGECVVIGQIAKAPFHVASRGEWQERNVFHLQAPADLPDSWTHVVQAQGEDQGLVFVYEWMALEEAASKLGAGQGRWLPLVAVANGEP